MSQRLKTKNYCTTSSVNNACYFRRDYSYSINGKCLDCKFCPSKTGKNKQRLYLSKYIENEAEHSKQLYSAPVTISKYCDPFLNETYKRHSLYVAQNIIDNGGQVIFKTCLPGNSYQDILDFCIKNKDQVHLHLRMFVNDIGKPPGIGDPNVAQVISKLLTPNRTCFRALLARAVMAIEGGVDVVFEIDPVIIGVNDTGLLSAINKINLLGCKKIIFKQLFATDHFKAFLGKHIDGKYVNLLSERVGKFWTYKNDALLYSLLSSMSMIKELEMKVSFCMNRELNDLTKQWLHYDGNCCHVDEPIGLYNIDGNLMDRLKPQVIKVDYANV